MLVRKIDKEYFRSNISKESMEKYIRGVYPELMTKTGGFLGFGKTVTYDIEGLLDILEAKAQELRDLGYTEAQIKKEIINE